jgi:RND family efflux transporter MFP subunit
MKFIIGSGFSVLYLIFAPATSIAQTPIYSTGIVTARQSATLSSRVSEVVIKINHDVGSKVSRGDTVITLDDSIIRADVAMAKAGLESAKAGLGVARADFDRIEKLYAQKAVTKREYEVSKGNYLGAKSGVAKAKANLEKSAAVLGYAKIKAPFDGQVDDRFIETGELAGMGRPVVRITDTKNLRFETTVVESRINNVKIGEAVKIVLDAMPGRTLNGRVVQIVATGDKESHSFIVRIDLETGSAEHARIGMYGKVNWQ